MDLIELYVASLGSHLSYFESQLRSRKCPDSKPIYELVAAINRDAPHDPPLSLDEIIKRYKLPFATPFRFVRDPESDRFFHEQKIGATA